MFTYEEAMRPILTCLAEQPELQAKDIAEAVATHFRLSEADRGRMQASGFQATYRNRVAWGVSTLYKARMIERVRRGVYRITDAGRSLISSGPAEITDQLLKQLSPEFAAYIEGVRSGQRRGRNDAVSLADTGTGDESPEEVLDRAHRTLTADLATQILDSIAECSPAFFERLVVQLLVKMGYGGSFEDAAQSVGRSGDGGIDGIIKEDRLGLDAIYVQAKRWKDGVGRPQIQAFVGALTGHRARKGVFITSSSFSREAREYVRNLDAKVVLIDGETLADYMIEVGLGVTLVQTYEVKRLDSDFFEG
jgi:restriction system protein